MDLRKLDREGEDGEPRSCTQISLADRSEQ
jgi:hypothetical protein